MDPFTGNCLYDLKRICFTGLHHILFQLKPFFFPGASAVNSLSSAPWGGMPLDSNEFAFALPSKMQVTYSFLHMSTCRSNGRILCRSCYVAFIHC